jgi:large subunit ribosomal protein L6
MSNIGKKQIILSSEVNIQKHLSFMLFQGIYGALKLQIPSFFRVIQKENKKFFISPLFAYKKNKKIKSLWGTLNINFKNLTFGIANNFKLKMQLVGVGYKVFKKHDKLTLKLGLSHRKFLEFPFSMVTINRTQKRPLNYLVSSSNYELLKSVSSFLRSFKKPEPYKLKGFSFKREILKSKEGKKVKN